jgi:hypothetical protein
MLQRLVGILRPHHSGTEANAVEFALYRSLELLHGTVLAASLNYAEAAEAMNAWALQLKLLDHWANEAGWAIARSKALKRHRAAQSEPPD